MQPYFEPRRKLAQAYGTAGQWRLAAEDMLLDLTQIALQEPAIAAWSNILKAVRTNGQMNGLRQLLAREQPHLLPAFDGYATAIARGETVPADFPALEAIALDEDELKPENVSRWFEFQQPLPSRLLDLLRLDRPLGKGDIDPLLTGGNTAAAKSRLVNFNNQRDIEMRVLIRLRGEISGQKDKIDGEIRDIESASPPLQPMRPYTANVTGQRAALLYEEHNAKMTSYQSALSAFLARRDTLGQLREKADALSLELKKADARKESERSARAAMERMFLADIAQARDLDLLHELDRAVDLTAAALRVEATAFQGFWAMLETSCFLDLAVAVVSQPSAAAELGRRFRQAAERWTEPLESGLTGIARRCLGTLVAVNRLLLANRAEVAGLMDRLNQLPSEQLQERRQRMQDILGFAVAAIPDFRRLQTEHDVEGVKNQLTGMQTSTTALIERSRTEIGREPDQLKRTIEPAQADFKATIERIADVASRNGELLTTCSDLWNLIRRGRDSTNLPALAQGLCAALPLEFNRRANVGPESVIDDARRSNFELNSAQSMMNSHLLTQYLAARCKLPSYIEELELAHTRIEAARREIDHQYSRVAQGYRQRLVLIAALSIIPGISLLTSLSAAWIVGRLRPLLISRNVLPYIKLAAFASAALAWAVAASVIAGVMMLAVMFYAGVTLGPSEGEIACIAIASLLAIPVSIRNLLVMKKYLLVHGSATADRR